MDEIVGRDRELESVERWLGAGRPPVLVIEGEAGIGKTTLWRAGVARAEERGRLPLTCSLSEGEAQLAFAGLSDLVRPYLDDVLPSLAPPQRRALEEALLLSESSDGMPDERAVAFGFLGLVIELARKAQLAIAVDDLQWLDASSLAVLRFGARRLRTEPVVFLLARRIEGPAEHAADPPGFGQTERIEVGPLSLGALHRMLTVRLGHPLTRPVLRRVHVAANGNPLHALELARTLHPVEPEYGRSVARLLQARVAGLPDDAREALALAALASTPTVSLLSRAAERDIVAALHPAIASELVFVDRDQVRFTHPLVASAARDVAGDDAPRLHGALARVSDSVEDRALHLGRATTEPDEAVARILEDAARDVLQRGARSVAAELYERAARLTPVSAVDERASRLLAAGWASWEGGDPEHARTLLAEVVDGSADGGIRADALGRLGVALAATGRWADAVPLWSEVLESKGDPGLRSEAGRWLALMTAATGSVTEAEGVADRAVSDAEESGDARRLAYALAARAFVAALEGGDAYKPLIARALQLDSGLHGGFGEWSPTWFAAECARHAGDVEAARLHYRAVLDDAVGHGDASVEVVAAYGLASAELLAGDVDHADRLAETVSEIAEQTGVLRIPALSLRAQVDAHLGRTDSARQLLAALEELTVAAGDRINLVTTCSVLGFLSLSEGEFAAAALHYGRARELSEELGFRSAIALRTFLYEVEAAAAAGRLEQAESALEAFDSRARADLPRWAAVVHARARAALCAARGDLESAETLLERGLAEDEGTMPLEQARSLLALGAIQRRARKRAAARATLDEALSRFEALGTVLWADRAKAELQRIGGRAPADGLTPNEERVAELVAAGKSNKDVAAELVVSVHTIEAALTSIYRKLGVRSRTQLARELAALDLSKH